MTLTVISPPITPSAAARRSRREGVARAELVRMLRIADPDDLVLGRFVADHADLLARRLGCDPSTLRTCASAPAHALVPELNAFLKAADEEASAQRKHHQRRLAEHAAMALGTGVRWSGAIAYLDVACLLGDVLADSSFEVVRFSGPGLDVNVRIDVLRGVRDEHPCPQADLTVFVSRHQLHIRWANGRGGLNLKCRPLPVYRADRALTVHVRGVQARGRRPRAPVSVPVSAEATR